MQFVEAHQLAVAAVRGAHGAGRGAAESVEVGVVVEVGLDATDRPGSLLHRDHPIPPQPWLATPCRWPSFGRIARQMGHREGALRALPAPKQGMAPGYWPGYEPLRRCARGHPAECVASSPLHFLVI